MADRDLLVMGGLCAFGGAMLIVNVELVLAAGLAATLLGAPLQLTPPGGWIGTGVQILANAGDPGRTLSPPWTSLAGHPIVYWTVAVVLLGLSAIAATPIIGLAWRRWGPTPAGHATRSDIRRELSLTAARRTAEWTRPGLSEQDRARAPLEEVAAPLHRGPAGVMCSPLTSPTGTFAPTQTGKSRRDLVHKVLGAPGALLCSTTKTDLLEFAALARTRRRHAGPVLVFDATGTAPWPAQVQWSPIAGCSDLRSAYQRAHTMVEAAAVNLTEGNSGNDRVFRERATMVVAAYLLAAELHDCGVGVLVRWAIEKPPSLEPAQLLEPHYPELARNLRAEIGMVEQTSDAVWLSVRRAIEPFLDPNLLRLCTPRPEQGFDARTHIRQGGSLFLIAGQHQAAHAVPILTALTEHWLTTAQQMALEYPTRRLEPPATAVLDELCNATPIPQLPDIISDSAGRGVIIHWAAQSAAQLEDTYSPVRARALLDNTTTMSVWGGLKDERTLEWISTLSGHRERMRWQQHSEGLMAPGRSSMGSETVPTYRPGDVRTLDSGRVLVIHRNLDPILARAVDVSQRADWRQLRRDVEGVRSGYIGVDVDGFAA
jgi:type IV secretory pathway TraG/TraD family ATPase VirD4